MVSANMTLESYGPDEKPIENRTDDIYLQENTDTDTHAHTLQFRIVESARNNEYWSDTIAINIHEQGKDFILKFRRRKYSHLST